MDVNQLLARAWAAVEQSGVPDDLQEVAFQEAVAYLRSDAEPTESRAESGSQATSPPSGDMEASAGEDSEARTDEDFFETLAHQSGVDEQELRQVFFVDDDGQPKIMQPARELGDFMSTQTRAVVTLLGGARYGGLRENPVSAQVIRDVCNEKGCKDSNFSKHLDDLAGFNLSGDDLLVTPRWVDEFDSAVGRVIDREMTDES